MIVMMVMMKMLMMMSRRKERERERVREKSIPIDDDDNQKVDTLAQIWFKRRGASTCTLQHMPVSSSASHRTATQVGAAIHKQLPLPLHIVACTDRQRTVDSGPKRDNNKQRLANHPANRRLRGRSCGTAREAVLSTAAPRSLHIRPPRQRTVDSARRSLHSFRLCRRQPP